MPKPPASLGALGEARSMDPIDSSSAGTLLVVGFAGRMQRAFRPSTTCDGPAFPPTATEPPSRGAERISFLTAATLRRARESAPQRSRSLQERRLNFRGQKTSFGHPAFASVAQGGGFLHPTVVQQIAVEGESHIDERLAPTHSAATHALCFANS